MVIPTPGMLLTILAALLLGLVSGGYGGYHYCEGRAAVTELAGVNQALTDTRRLAQAESEAALREAQVRADARVSAAQRKQKLTEVLVNDKAADCVLGADTYGVLLDAVRASNRAGSTGPGNPVANASSPRTYKREVW